VGVTVAVDPVLARAVAAAAAARAEIEAQAVKLRAAVADVADFYAHPEPGVRTWPLPSGHTLVFRQGRKRTWGFYVDRYPSGELSLALLMAVAVVLEGEVARRGPAPATTKTKADQEGAEG